MTPGFYENGSVYVHGNGFWMLALAEAGMPDAALRAWQAVLPVRDNKPNVDSEPFVIPNYYIGPAGGDRAQRNLFLSGWRTGSAAWMWISLWEGLLGFKPGYHGLDIAPRLPAAWPEASGQRLWRGTPLAFHFARDAKAPAHTHVPVTGTKALVVLKG